MEHVDKSALSCASLFFKFSFKLTLSQSFMTLQFSTSVELLPVLLVGLLEAVRENGSKDFLDFLHNDS